MKQYRRIVFVSRSDMCRAPMAAAIYHRLDSTGEIEAVSRGLVVLFPEPINSKAALVLENHETPCTKAVSEKFSAVDAGPETLILTMTEDQKKRLAEDYGITEHVFTLKEFAGESGDIQEPFGGGTLGAYQDCYSELVRLVKKTLFTLTA